MSKQYGVRRTAYGVKPTRCTLYSVRRTGFMFTPLWFAYRYFSSVRRQHFLPWLTVISVGGVTLGVFALITVLSVMRGFGSELEKRMMGFNAHITITKTQGSSDTTEKQIYEILSDRVSNIIPFVEGEAIAQSKSLNELSATGVKVRGIEPLAMGRLSELEFYFPENSNQFEDLDVLHRTPYAVRRTEELPGIILGSELLKELTVHPDFEDTIELIAPLSEVGPTGELEPRMRNYRLIGAFRSGVYEYDSKFVFVSLPEALRVLGEQATSGWQIILKDASSAPEVASMLRSKLGDAQKIESWDIQNKKLFAALKLERWAMGAILLMIVLIASFSIIGVIFMVVSGRRKDIAILRAMGMSGVSVRRIFVFYSMKIGIIGSAIGGILGIAACIFLMKEPIHLPASYYLDILPVELSFGWTLLFIITGVAIAMLASLYPVSCAVKEDPAVILRCE